MSRFNLMSLTDALQTAYPDNQITQDDVNGFLKTQKMYAQQVSKQRLAAWVETEVFADYLDDSQAKSSALAVMEANTLSKPEPKALEIIETPVTQIDPDIFSELDLQQANLVKHYAKSSKAALQNLDASLSSIDAAGTTALAEYINNRNQVLRSIQSDMDAAHEERMRDSVVNAERDRQKVMADAKAMFNDYTRKLHEMHLEIYGTSPYQEVEED